MRYDVAIVGAGIAGATAANKLSKAGLKVIVLEREKNPSTSFCGEMTNYATIKRLGLSRNSKEVIATYSKNKMIYLDNGFEISVPKSEMRLYLIETQDIKKSLIEEAVTNGAKINFNTTVKSIFKEKGKVTGVQTKNKNIRANIVIGADGSKSLIAKTAGFPLNAYKTLPSFRYKYKNADIKNDKEARFYLSRDIGLGYLWVYPRNKKEVNVGIGAINNPNMANFFNKFTKNMAELKNAKIYAKGGDTIPYSGVLSKIAKNGVALVGDAAGQTDALVGGGLRSSTKAVEILIPFVIRASENSSAILDYDKEYQLSEEAKKINKAAKTLEILKRMQQKKQMFNLFEEIQETFSSEALKKAAMGELGPLNSLAYILKHPVLSYKIMKEIKF